MSQNESIAAQDHEEQLADFTELVPEEDKTIWRYNGNEFSFDMGDADDLAHFEEVMDRFQKAEMTVKRDGSLAEQVIAYDAMYRNMYDDLFGDGAGDAILGQKRNMNNCNLSYASFLEFLGRQGAEFQRQREIIEQKQTFYAPNGNRSQRRFNAKHNRKR